MTRNHSTSMAALVFALVSVSACTEPNRTPRASDSEAEDGSSESSSAGEPTVELELDEIMNLMGDYQDRLVPYHDEHEYSETHADAASVKVWGSSEARETFLGIDPENNTQAVTFTEGTTFVKEHFDEAEALIGLTVMYKGPAGYNPSAGDWYWIRMRGEEVTHYGRDFFCIDCHEAAINTDFVVGFGKSQ